MHGPSRSMFLASAFPRLLAPLLLALFVRPALAAELRGLVVGGHDGDTHTLLTPQK